MKALVLSGGKGTRLRPITHTFAKQLIPIANKPILFYGLEGIAEAGIKEVGIIVGDTQNEIRGAVGDGSRFGLKITYIYQEAPLGLAHAVKIARDFIGQDPFLMYLGDNLLKSSMKGLVEDFVRHKPEAQILVVKVPHPEQFGVVELQDGRVVRLVEKPKQPKSDLALAGVYLFSPRIFEAVEAIKPSNRGELEITDAIQWLVDQKYKVLPKTVEGWWKDTGKLEDLLEANRIMLEDIQSLRHPQTRVDLESRLDGKVVLEQGAEILHSTLRGPIVIGKNTRIQNSYVGPFTSIAEDVVVEDSEIEHSILLEHVRIRGVRRIQDSLIGQRVEVVKSKAKPEAYRIMAGDSSRIEFP